MIGPIEIVREAIRTTPVVRYALAVAAFAAAVAIVLSFQMRAEVAVFGTTIVIGFSFIIVVLAYIGKKKDKRLVGPALFAVWSFIVLLITIAALLTTCYFFQWPKPFERTLSKTGEPVVVTYALKCNWPPTAPVKLSFIHRENWGAKPSTANVTEIGHVYRISVHHTAVASQYQMNAGGAALDTQKFQMERDWADISYHFIVAADGSIAEGRDIFTQGASLGNTCNNEGTIMVAMAGDYTKQPLSRPALESMRRLLAYLVNKYSIDKRMILTHREFRGGIAPGDSLQAFVEQFRCWTATYQNITDVGIVTNRCAN